MKGAPRRHQGCSMLRKVLLVVALLFSGVVFVLSRHVELSQQPAQGNAPAEVHSEFVPRNPGIARGGAQQLGASAAENAPSTVIGRRGDDDDTPRRERAHREPASLRGSMSVPKDESNPDRAPVAALEKPAASQVEPQEPVDEPEKPGREFLGRTDDNPAPRDAPRPGLWKAEVPDSERPSQPKYDEPQPVRAPGNPDEPEQLAERPDMLEPAQLQVLPPELVTPQSRASEILQRTLRRTQSLKTSNSDLTCTSPAVLLHQLLRHGEFLGDQQPSSVSKSTKSGAKTTLALHDTVQSELQRTGLFLEYSSSAPDKSLAFRYAASQVRATVVHIYLTNGQPFAEFYKPSPSNLLVIPSKGRSIDELRLRDTKACAAQLLAGWEELVQDMLPHEFENAIGRLLCQCDATIAPANLPVSAFFSYWGTVHQLIAEATAAADLQDCKLTVSTLRTPYVTNSEPVERQIKITKSSKQESDSGVDDISSSSVSSSSSSRFRSTEATTTDDINSDGVGSSSSSPSSSSSSSSSSSYSSSSSSRFRSYSSTVSSGTIIGESAHAMLNKDLSGIAFNDLVTLGVADSDLANLACTLFDHARYKSQAIQYSELAFAAGAVRKNPSSTPETPRYSSTGSRYQYQYQYGGSSGGSSRSFASGAASGHSERSDTWTQRRLTSGSDLASAEAEDANEGELRRRLVSDFSNEYADWLFPTDADIERTEQPEAPSTMTSLTDGVRLRQAHLARQEMPQLRQWAEVLQHDFEGTTTAAVFGRRGALLTAKVAKKLGSQATVVSWNPTHGQSDDHMKLLRVMGAENVIFTTAKLTAGRLAAAAVAPQKFETCLIQADVLFDLLVITKHLDHADQNCDLQLLYDLAALLIKACDTAFVQLPPVSVLTQIVDMAWPLCAHEIVRSLRPARGTTAQASSQLIQRILSALVGSGPVAAVPLGKLASPDDSVIYKCSVASHSDHPAISNGAVNWYSVMNLGVIPQQRKQLLPLVLHALMEAPSSAGDIEPWQVWLRKTVEGGFSVHIGSAPSFSSGEHTADEHQLQRRRAAALWRAVKSDLLARPAELSGGQFSAVEYNSGYGYFSALLAKQFPEATVLSVGADQSMADYHAALVAQNELWNNAVCMHEALPTVFKNVYESPEYFRFQFFMSGFVDLLTKSATLHEFGTNMGTMLSTALTSYLSVPNGKLVSRAVRLLFPDLSCGTSAVSVTAADSVFLENPGPLPISASGLALENTALKPAGASPVSNFFAGIQEELLGAYSRTLAGTTKIAMTTLSPAGSSIPIVRCDVLNMTRNVHHHYDYAKDGHSRTYTMKVAVNTTATAAAQALLGNIGAAQRRDQLVISTGATVRQYQLPLGYHVNGPNVVGVHLMRDRDGFHIPYVHIHGITLIAALRMGLHQTLRARAFSKFLDLPLYEDMAPWNVVLMGPRVDYIDYDTRDFTFDRLIPHSYQIMSALMNYKRTVQDFGRCGQKSKNEYGLPFVSDCVGSEFNGPCPDPRLPVPCGDGTCHSDYISCLRSLAKQEIEAASKAGEQVYQPPKLQSQSSSGVFEFGPDAS